MFSNVFKKIKNFSLTEFIKVVFIRKKMCSSAMVGCVYKLDDSKTRPDSHNAHAQKYLKDNDDYVKNDNYISHASLLGA